MNEQSFTRQIGTLKIKTAAALLPLLEPRTHKGAKGGRSAGKSEFFCERIIEDCLAGHHRVACLREVQNSIKDSVKQLLEDKIKAFGVDPLFKVTDQEIIGPHESLIIFKGLQNHTAASFKSVKGFDRAFVEEAQTISRRSLDIFLPTLRENDPEISFAWNPISPTDPVDRLFTDNKDDPNFICVHLTYKDNPWLPRKSLADVRRDRVRDPDKFAHVWLGEYQQLSEARVFRNWRIDTFDEPTSDTRFYYGCDWGFSVDPTVLVRCFIRGRNLFVDREAWKVGLELDHTPAFFAAVPGAKRWPIKADSANPQSISYMCRHGFRMEPSVKGPGSVEEGVEFLKSYDIIVHPRCTHVSDELATYSYEIDKHTGDILPKLADKKNHTIDALRYALEAVRRAPATPVFGRYGQD